MPICISFYFVLCYVTLNAALSTTSQPNPKREGVKVLVLGSSGRLGREVVRELSALSRDLKSSLGTREGLDLQIIAHGRDEEKMKESLGIERSGSNNDITLATCDLEKMKISKSYCQICSPTPHCGVQLASLTARVTHL